MTVKETNQMVEQQMLSPYAVLSANSRGRKLTDENCEVRTWFQQDIDRIIHSKSFRRLKHKTQMFLTPEGDHYRTRLTHVIEVDRIARTAARALRLNEDLTEAMALGHDLGHTPFGHAGEFALDEIVPGGYKHNEQSARVVEKLEREGAGLNLTYEVVEGILRHTGRIPSETCEGRVLKFADRIAYINHDIDDAERAGVLTNTDIPKHLRDILGEDYSGRINTMVVDLIKNSKDGDIAMSPEIGGAMLELRDFMFENVYRNPEVKGEETKARDMLLFLYSHYVSHPDLLPHEYLVFAEEDGVERVACDYIAGMTDTFAIRKFREIFIPMGWEHY